MTVFFHLMPVYLKTRKELPVSCRMDSLYPFCVEDDEAIAVKRITRYN